MSGVRTSYDEAIKQQQEIVSNLQAWHDRAQQELAEYTQLSLAEQANRAPPDVGGTARELHRAEETLGHLETAAAKERQDIEAGRAPEAPAPTPPTFPDAQTLAIDTAREAQSLQQARESQERFEALNLRADLLDERNKELKSELGIPSPNTVPAPDLPGAVDPAILAGITVLVAANTAKEKYEEILQAQDLKINELIEQNPASLEQQHHNALLNEIEIADAAKHLQAKHDKELERMEETQAKILEAKQNEPQEIRDKFETKAQELKADLLERQQIEMQEMRANLERSEREARELAERLAREAEERSRDER